MMLPRSHRFWGAACDRLGRGQPDRKKASRTEHITSYNARRITAIRVWSAVAEAVLLSAAMVRLSADVYLRLAAIMIPGALFLLARPAIPTDTIALGRRLFIGKSLHIEGRKSRCALSDGEFTVK